MPGHRTIMVRSTPLALALLSCDPPPRPLPTADAVERQPPTDALPPLVVAVYDAPVAPAPVAREQRVRLLLWLRRMALDPGQLDRLDALRKLALDQQDRVQMAEAKAVEGSSELAARTWDGLWEKLAAGASPDDPTLQPLIGDLGALSAGGARERAVLGVRLEGTQLVLEAERGLLDTLSETQQERLVEGLFVLRRRLDPLGTPGDWDALVGPTFDVGAPGLLLRGSSAGVDDPLDLGGLWTGSDEHPELPGARREAILYLVLLQPGLDEAIAAARATPPPTPADRPPAR